MSSQDFGNIIIVRRRDYCGAESRGGGGVDVFDDGRG